MFRTFSFPLKDEGRVDLISLKVDWVVWGLFEVSECDNTAEPHTKTHSYLHSVKWFSDFLGWSSSKVKDFNLHSRKLIECEAKYCINYSYAGYPFYKKT